jgi:radical SAM superfamily enzyme YgiQ (UPF0313 family)
MEFLSLNNPHNQQRDFVFVTVPWTASNLPLMAPAVLKPVIEKAGLTCLAVDLNVEVYRSVSKHPDYDKFLKFFFDDYLHNDIRDDVLEIFTSMAEQIVSWKPRYVGLSLLTYIGQHSAKWLGYMIKKLDPTIQIIVGGTGCLDTHFTGKSTYTTTLIDAGIFDHHIRGDAEHSLYEFLTGNHSYPGINSIEWKELEREDLVTLPIPDYSDYHLDLYNKKVLGIVGTRGCVRNCKFCDVIANWKNFRWRNGDHIFEEILYQRKRYNVSGFKFQDSLVNGNQKEYLNLITRLADYNIEHPNATIQWNGFFIFRDVTKNSEKEWELLKQSGCQRLMVGIENFNEHIRYEIGKKFSNASIDFHLKQAQKYKIRLVFMIITGYVTETRQDVDNTKIWLEEHVDYADVLTMQFGGTLGIFPNTYLEKNLGQYGAIMIGTQPQQWINPSIGSTPSVRATWAKELIEYSKSLGYRTADNLDNHLLLENLINESI